jgi:hypothetical protein
MLKTIFSFLLAMHEVQAQSMRRLACSAMHSVHVAHACNMRHLACKRGKGGGVGWEGERVRGVTWQLACKGGRGAGGGERETEYAV